MYCHKCGSKTTKKANFCKDCGIGVSGTKDGIDIINEDIYLSIPLKDMSDLIEIKKDRIFIKYNNKKIKLKKNKKEIEKIKKYLK